ncbi:BglG family transcription antiterminator [Shouchella shacheensis]|uniref:BglG family transcription antiterminator n=1 Tax=Shouchella shacheensis TaxID=1649580 RepID=UPI00073FE979|nr:BglG family transcription antiterminator [Shouchella shacheensis]
MHISARERLILLALFESDEGLTLSELATSVAVSPRTIQRDLKGLKKIAASYGLMLKRDQRDQWRVNGPLHKQDQLENVLRYAHPADFTPEERQSLLIATLLDNREPIKLFALAKELNVTQATVSNDLSKVVEWLELFGLQLVRKRGYGVKIVGSETNLRRAMSRIIADNVNEGTFYQTVYASTEKELEHEIASRLLHFVDIHTIRLVVKTVEPLKPQMLGPMADQSYIGLIVHLTLAIERIRQGERIQMDTSQLEALEHEEAYPVAVELGKKLERVFAISIPPAEIGYIVMHLRGAKSAEARPLHFEESNAELVGRIKKMIAGVEEELEVVLDDPTLLQGLLAHLKPALYRLRQEMKITNPLLDRIRKDYQSLFASVGKQVQKAFAPLLVPDEEVAYIALHFGAVLERRRESGSFSALVVCSSGIGSARMLASRIEQEFPEITKVTNVSLFEMDRYRLEDYDLLLSTVRLEQNKQALHVSPVLTTEEVSRVRTFIDSLKPREKGSRAYNSEIKRTGPSTFVHVTSVSKAIYDVLTSFMIEEAATVREGVQKCLADLEKRGHILQAEAVYQALLKRETLGGLAIPETELALFHTRTTDVQTPVIRIINLNQWEFVSSMGSEEERVRRIIVMLAPEETGEQALAFMSYVSMLLVGSREQTSLFETGSEQEVYGFLEQKCRDYIVALIQEGVESI